MVDFNAKKEILRRLQKKGAKNVFMRILCAVAALFVKIWYGIACRFDMVLSDRHGNLFGIKGLGEKTRSRRQDDIVYVKKPFLGRVLSAVLAVSFTFMVAPELVPELEFVDLGINASAAADISNTVKVIVDGQQIEMYRDLDKSSSDGDQYLVRKDDYDNANKFAVNILGYDVGYGNIRITWELDPAAQQIIDNSDQRITLDGFLLEVYQNGVIVNGNGRGEKLGPRVTNLVVSVPSVDDEVYAVIRPISIIKEYLFQGTLDDLYTEDASVSLTQKVTFELQGPTSGSIADAVTPNARFNIPVLTVNGGDENSYTNRVELTWEIAEQIGGKGSDQGKQADGYIIYRRTVGGTGTAGTFRELVTLDDPTATTYTDSTISYGTHYEYFIEAYRIGWGTSKGYDANNPALITSSGGNASATPEVKGNTTYSRYVKDLYVVPAEPELKVTANNRSNTIDLTWGPKSGDYSGVLLFRTRGADSELDPEKLDLGGMRFSDWIRANVGNYGIERIAQLSKNVNSYNDLDIVEGETYWYYAIAYLEKDGGDGVWLYGSVARNSSRLDLNLSTPLALMPSVGDGQVSLTWESVSGANGYELKITKTHCFYGDDEDEGLPTTEIIDLGNKTSYLHSFLYNNDKYTYQVRAYINIRSTDTDNKELSKFYSDWSGARNVTVGLPLPAPQNVSATTVDGAVTVKWDRVNNATEYTLFYTNLTTGESGKFAGLTGTTYTQTNLINGERYTYYVRAYKKINGDGSHGVQEIPSDPSNSVTIRVGVELTIPQDLKATTTDGQVTVSWSSVSGAEGYILEYRRLPNQNWDFDISSGKGLDGRSIDLSNKTTYNHTMLQNGDMYEYRVRAYKTVSGERVYSDTSVTVSITVGTVLDTPKDFTVTTTDGVANLKWTASKNAEGYVVYAYSAGQMFQYDVSKTQFDHTGLINGDTWTYYVVAYKTVNGSRVYSSPTQSVTITVGVSMAAAVDLIATPGNRQIVLSWTAVTGAQGYVVYLYNDYTMEYEPIAVTSKPGYTHLGLKNGQGYTYMVAAYKTINGTRVYGEYSMPVTAIPTSGSMTDIDRELTIKGTAPYGISHGEYISAGANHGAFDESVDVYFTTNEDSANAVKDVLKGYAGGLSSFIIYPFDISIYKENTLIKVDPNRGYSVTITMPIPDRLIAYRDYITVIHINENADTEYITDLEWLEYTDRRLEVLPCAVIEIDNVWCIQFECTSFSPYAIVIYKDHLSDVSAGGGVMDGIFAGNFNSGVLLFTTLPDILPNNKKLRIVFGGKKKYRIKSIEKRDV